MVAREAAELHRRAARDHDRGDVPTVGQDALADNAVEAVDVAHETGEGAARDQPLKGLRRPRTLRRASLLGVETSDPYPDRGVAHPEGVAIDDLCHPSRESLADRAVRLARHRRPGPEHDERCDQHRDEHCQAPATPAARSGTTALPHAEPHHRNTLNQHAPVSR